MQSVQLFNSSNHLSNLDFNLLFVLDLKET